MAINGSYRNKLLRDRAYSAGRWINAKSRACIRVHNPASGQSIGTVPSLGTAETRDAISAAQIALPSWRSLLPRERGDILMRWHNLILQNCGGLSGIITAEQGKPLPHSEDEVRYGASFLCWFAEEASRTYGHLIPSHLPNHRLLVQREPLGVVGLVTPWNFPLAMLLRKAGAALAAGCTVVAVPSPQTPFSALALAALSKRARIPPGVFSILTGDANTLVKELCNSRIVRGLSFTGSTTVGRIIMAQCASTVKRVSLELGGHAPFIAFPDVDIEVASRAAAVAKYQTSGQDCLAANRIFVHKCIYEAFVSSFTRITRNLRVGDGFEPGTEMGPLTNEAALSKCREHVADALAKGARLVTGGGLHPLGGLFYEPTVLADVTAEMKIMREETFGPVAALASFEEEGAVIDAANATEYGLVAYVFTNDLSRAHRVSDALEFGMVGVNTVRLTGAPIPFGGVKQSGLGREGSRFGIDEFTEMKYVSVSVEPIAF